MIDKLEDALNGNFLGLYSEVAKSDCYKFRALKFIPDLFIDCGANVGVATRFVKELFPKVEVVAVEPNPDNIAVFKKFTDMTNVILLEGAIGVNEVYHNTNAPNGAHEAYLSISDQISKEDIETSGVMQLESVPLYMVDKLISTYLLPFVKSVMKIDIEGNENVIWEHQPSMEALKRIDYIVVEIHPHALHGIEKEKAKQNLQNAIAFLSETHDVEYEHIYLFATKR